MISSALYSVLIECQGGFPEQFLNLAAEQHIALWDVHRRDITLTCRTAAVDYARLRPLARRACVRMRIRKKQGVGFRIRRLGLRLGTAVGLVLFFLVLHLLSSRVWVLRVQGNFALSDDEILTLLEPLGVYEGADFSAVDLTELRLSALQRQPDLIWLAVNQSGSIVTIEVEERSPTAPVEDTDPVNLVASCDGVIEHIDAVCGQAVVKVGDAVRRGDLLISGVMDSKVGPQLKHAAGTVTARVTHTLHSTVPLSDTVERVERVVTRSAVSVFGWNVPLYTGGSLPAASSVDVDRRFITANGVPLPIGIIKEQHTYLKRVPVTRSAQNAFTLAREQLKEKRAALPEDFMVEKQTIRTEKTESSVTVTAVCHGTQSITEERPILR